MEKTGKEFPRIHSITTVGIRNHVNINLLIHEMRTDFTGQSGSGKSLVGADIPQLILTAGRYYKSATKPKGNVSRDYNTLPLKDFGYCLMNIEKVEHEYITIGVFIRKSPKQLHPFIVQASIGIDPIKNPVFKTLKKPLRHQDFIVNNEILTLENVKDHLDKRNIYLTSYFHNIPSYHKLLSVNKIIHMDLSADENLQRQYAHTLQSLARGEDIDTSGIKFKKFLFHYEDEIASKFRTQAQQIEDDHDRYIRDWETQNLLTKKKDLLQNLLALKKKQQEAFELRLSKEAFYYYQLKNKKEKEYKDTIEQVLLADLETLSIEETLVEIEMSKLENEKKQKEKELEGQQKLFNDANTELETIGSELAEINETLPRLEREKDDLKIKRDKIVKVIDWLKQYNSIDELKNVFEKQKTIIRQEEKLNALNSFLNRSNLSELFKQSRYSKSVKEGIEFYAKRREEINTEISYLEKIKDIIATQSVDSFAGWAVKEQKQLNQLQESVLFHFATLPTKYDANEHFIPEPRGFIESLKTTQETEKTFIVNLGGLFYHIPKRLNYIFTNPSELKSKIEKIGKNFQKQISDLQTELGNIEKLDRLFSELNYSDEHLLAYLNADKIQSYDKDLTLNLTNDQFSDCLKEYEEDDKQRPALKVHKLYELKSEIFQEKLGRKNRSNEIIRTQNTIKLQSSAKIKEISSEVKGKEERISHLRNTEVKALEGKLILWKSNLQNTFENKDQMYHQYKQKYKNTKEESELRKSLTELVRKSSPLAAMIPQLTRELPILDGSFRNKREEYERYFKISFNENELVPMISEDELQGLKSTENSSKLIYEDKYCAVFEEFKDDLKDSPKLKQHNFDLSSLILELIPQDIITNKENPEESLVIDIESKLSELHQKIKELSKEEATKIKNTVREIRSIVTKQTTFLDQIKALLQDFTLATHRKVQLEWHYSPDFDIKWIEALQRDINELNFEDNLFGERTKLNAHELLEKTFKKYCPAKLDAKAHEILNPFNYYDASAIIVDHKGTPSPGSTGQNYGMLALLCIAKLSIVEGKTKNIFQKIEPGIRILPIDEVAGLGENYDMLYEIAQRLDYQIFTMTISANDLEFEEGKQIYYEFIPNSRKELGDYNEGVQACFSKNNLIHDLETYFDESVYSLENAK